MRVASLQMRIIKGDKDKNISNVDSLIGNNKLDLVVLPELFSTGYFFEEKSQIELISEEIPNGDTTKKLLEIAARKECHIVGTLIEREDNKNYITSILAGPKGYIGKHRKRHLTTDELEFYTPGSESEVYEINGCKIGIVVCFEGWFPERIRELLLKGAQIICHSALIMSDKTMNIMKVRAIENNMFIVIANSISSEYFKGNNITFRGESRIYDTSGNIIIDAGKEEKIIIAEIDEKESLKRELPDCRNIIEEIKKYK
jgi:predicted amidohydrolase